jgi:hypothetical protein
MQIKKIQVSYYNFDYKLEPNIKIWWFNIFLQYMVIKNCEYHFILIF